MQYVQIVWLWQVERQHHFPAQSSEDVDSVLVKVYEELVDNQNPHNLALFLDSYYK